MTVKSPYPQFSVRLLALGFDFAVAVFVAAFIDEYVLRSAGVSPEYSRLAIPIVLFFYFAGSWASPMRATPFQFLLGMQVVSDSGEAIGWARSVVRTVGFGLIFAGTMMVFRSADKGLYTAFAVIAYVLAGIAIVTPRRQAAHDFLVRTLVVRRAALEAGQPLGKEDVSTWRALRDVIVMGLLAYVAWSGAAITRDREMIHRVKYAVSETEDLKTAIEVFYAAESRWPADAEDLGLETRGEYPDGGYYEMEDDGVVRIQFEVLSELKDGSLVMTPVADEKGISWDCRVDGRIKSKYVPPMCRKTNVGTNYDEAAHRRHRTSAQVSDTAGRT